VKNYVAIIIQTFLLLAILAGWCMRIETSIAKIQTDLVWIKKELNQSQQSLENPIP